MESLCFIRQEFSIQKWISEEVTSQEGRTRQWRLSLEQSRWSKPWRANIALGQHRYYPNRALLLLLIFIEKEIAAAPTW